MIGLLALTALPTTIAVAEGISSQTRAAESARRPPDEKLMRKFRLRCYCAAKSRRSAEVHGRLVVVRDGKVWIQPPSSSSSSSSSPLSPPAHPFEGFYIPFPDAERPRPLPLGLVTSVAADPPVLHWVYVDAGSGEVRTGNRTQSRRHRVGIGGGCWIRRRGRGRGERGGEEWPDEDEEGAGAG
ncbi:MAG: hypothetical protein FRX48_01484 [Lasallia pustulata]|uniref:Uncharacterized protein n=1 Tax=Lasallia pustulata TaxID=136370 RepID=A0A5M8Q187_9LECA|nr:MAG: hypothetical protein FRX48_01484 [Lasallia pustulata]